MDRVYPVHILRFFYRFDIQIHNSRFLATSTENALQNLIRTGIDFLVRYVGWHVDKIT